jgi:hypothetical protein
MQWYFLSDTQEQVPVQEEHLPGLVQTGVVRPNTMIWREGMTEWISCSEAKPELFARRQVVPVVGAAATARQTAALQSHSSPVVRAGTTGMQMGDGQIVREAARALASASIWIKLIGVVLLVFGVIYILVALFTMVAGVSAPGMLILALIFSLVTGVVGSVVMWMGILLFQSASKAQDAAASGQKHDLLSALHQNAKFFKICGITVALVIAFYGLMIALALTGAMGGALVNMFDKSSPFDSPDGAGAASEVSDMENTDADPADEDADADADPDLNADGEGN